MLNTQGRHWTSKNPDFSTRFSVPNPEDRFRKSLIRLSVTPQKQNQTVQSALQLSQTMKPQLSITPLPTCFRFICAPFSVPNSPRPEPYHLSTVVLYYSTQWFLPVLLCYTPSVLLRLGSILKGICVWIK
jgi:hypothetical protein